MTTESKGGGRHNSGTIRAVQTVDALDEFLVSGTDAVCADAQAICADTKEPDAWAWVLLAIAAEKAAHQARQKMTPARYAATRKVVEEHIKGVRDAADSISDNHKIVAAAMR